MANLKNSQRISYKATYSQVSPKATTQSQAQSPTDKLSRAVEKAAYVQSLRIIQQELASLRHRSKDGAKPTADVVAQLPAAYAAIEQMLSDDSSSSTLNNAPLFANIGAPTQAGKPAGSRVAQAPPSGLLDLWSRAAQENAENIKRGRPMSSRVMLHAANRGNPLPDRLNQVAAPDAESLTMIYQESPDRLA